MDREELMTVVKLLGKPITENELMNMMESIDNDGSGELDWPEFVEIMRMIKKKEHRRQKESRREWEVLRATRPAAVKNRPEPPEVSDSEEEDDGFLELLQAAQQPHFKLSLLCGAPPTGGSRPEIPRVDAREGETTLDPARPLAGRTKQGRVFLLCGIGPQPVCANLALHLLGPISDSSNSRGVPEPFFPPADVGFIKQVAAAMRDTLCVVARRHALSTVLNQAVTWCHRHLAAGCAFALVPQICDEELPSSGLEQLQVCCASECRTKDVGTLYDRAELPLIFSAHDSGGLEVYEELHYDEVASPGPGRLGGGVTHSGALFVAVHEGGKPDGRVLATLAADLFMLDPLKAQKNCGVKRTFTDANVVAAAEAGTMAGEVLHSLLTEA